MPKVNTFNYDTIASWNGAQDLFVVEQPDGTKVATPAMVKQFIEAGNFTATGEITDGHGNILKDMAKSADVIASLAPILAKVNFTLYNQTYSDWNDFPTISMGFGVTGQAHSPGKNSFVICFGTDSGSTPVKIQIAFAADVSSQKYRCFVGTVWTAWTAF